MGRFFVNLEHDPFYYSFRAMSFRLDASLAAKQMGHSLVTHTQTYHLALNEREQRRAYDRSDIKKLIVILNITFQLHFKNNFFEYLS